MNILKGIKFIAAYRHANAVFFCFTRTHSTNEVGVGNFATSRNLMRINEKNCVISNNLITSESLFRQALSTLTQFIRMRFVPDVRIGTTKKRIDCFSSARDRIIYFASDGWVVLNRLCVKLTMRRIENRMLLLLENCLICVVSRTDIARIARCVILMLKIIVFVHRVLVILWRW